MKTLFSLLFTVILCSSLPAAAQTRKPAAAKRNTAVQQRHQETLRILDTTGMHADTVKKINAVPATPTPPSPNNPNPHEPNPSEVNPNPPAHQGAPVNPTPAVRPLPAGSVPAPATGKKQ